MPEPIGRELGVAEVVHASRIGWASLANGELIASAEQAGYDLLLTADQNIRYQQRLSGRRLAIVVVTTNSFAVLRAHVALITRALSAATVGSYAEVPIPRPPLRRRRPPT